MELFGQSSPMGRAVRSVGLDGLLGSITGQRMKIWGQQNMYICIDLMYT
jgi:hypothetical protein